MRTPPGIAFMRANSSRCFAIVLAFVLALSATCAFGQLAGKGTVVGTVADSTGAAVPGATVTATNVSTNAVLQRTATETGTYSLPPDPGLYNITVTATGFKQAMQKSVTVNALETLAVNITLELGTINQTVEVTGAVEQLDTATAQVTATMEQET